MKEFVNSQDFDIKNIQAILNYKEPKKPKYYHDGIEVTHNIIDNYYRHQYKSDNQEVKKL